MMFWKKGQTPAQIVGGSMRAIDAFNESGHSHDQYGAFEDGWNAAIRLSEAAPSASTNTASAQLLEELQGLLKDVKIAVGQIEVALDEAQQRT